MTTQERSNTVTVWYGRIIQLYPRRYREEYAGQLTQLFGDIYRDAAAEPVAIRRRIITRTFADTLAGIGREQINQFREKLMPTSPKLTRKNRILKYRWLIVSISVFAILVAGLQAFVFQPFKISGSSMYPTYKDGQYVLISKLPYVAHNHIPKYDQVIVFKFPKDPSSIFVKRVIGLPGDTVSIKNGVVRVLNSTGHVGLSQNFIGTGLTGGTVDNLVVPNGQVFVLGDNRSSGYSYDSREWGTLPVSDIIGSIPFSNRL